MDKMIAFSVIGFFLACACFITWGMLGFEKKNMTCKLMAYSYTAFTWVCVLALIALILVYKNLSL